MAAAVPVRLTPQPCWRGCAHRSVPGCLPRHCGTCGEKPRRAASWFAIPVRCVGLQRPALFTCLRPRLRVPPLDDDEGGARGWAEHTPPAAARLPSARSRGPQGAGPAGGAERSGARRPLPVPSQAGAAYIVPRGCGGECGVAGFRSVRAVGLRRSALLLDCGPALSRGGAACEPSGGASPC